MARDRDVGQTEFMTKMFLEAREAGTSIARQALLASDPLCALSQRLRGGTHAIAFTCARGSSDHAATYAKFLFETLVNVPVVSLSPSLVSIYGNSLGSTRGAPFFVLSQSGRSPDLLLSARAARDAGALIIAVVNDLGSPLAEIAEIVLPLSAGPEVSVAATKSYIATMTMMARLAALWSNDAILIAALDRLPDAVDDAWETDWSNLVPVLSATPGLFVLGRGSTLAIAQEAALKFKETCALHAEAFSLAEVAHGPMGMITPGFPVLVFPPADADGDSNKAVITTLQSAHAQLMIVGDTTLPAPVSPHPVLAPITMISCAYRLINQVAVARGRDPDHPPLLNKVTRTR